MIKIIATIIAVGILSISCKDNNEPEITEKVFRVEYIVTADKPDGRFDVYGDVSANTSCIKQFREVQNIIVKKPHNFGVQIFASSNDKELILTADIYVNGEFAVSETNKGEVMPFYYEKIEWGD